MDGFAARAGSPHNVNMRRRVKRGDVGFLRACVVLISEADL
jgi:hypothetical protein